MATRRARLYLSWLFGVVFLAIGLERALRALAIAPAPDLPAILFVTVLLQAIGALAAAVCLFAASRLVVIGLALFAGAFLVQLGADVLVYEIRAVLDAAGLAVAALALTLFAWMAQDRAPRGRLELEIPT
jgi:hypothetical protein